MGVVSSRSGPYGEYQLVQQGLILQRARVVKLSKDDKGNEVERPWLDISQSEEGDVSFQRIPAPPDSSASNEGDTLAENEVSFVCDPDCSTKSAKRTLLQITRHQDEQLRVDFEVSWDRSFASDNREQQQSVSLAYFHSPEDLDRMFVKRHEDTPHCYPALTVFNLNTDQPGNCSRLSWRIQPIALSYDGVTTGLLSSTTAQLENGQVQTPLKITKQSCSQILSDTQWDNGSEKSGKRFCAFMVFQPRLRTFIAVASFSFFVKIVPSKLGKNEINSEVCSPSLVVHASSSTPPNPSPDTLTSTPGMEYFSPSLGGRADFSPPFGPSSSPLLATRRTSLQSYRRHSFQSDQSSVYQSASPALSAEKHGAHLTPTVLRPKALRLPKPYRRSSTPPAISPRSGDPSLLPGSSSMHELKNSSELGKEAGVRAQKSRRTLAPLLPELDTFQDVPDDGPLFRAHCKEMEERAYYLRRTLKQLIKTTQIVQTSINTLNAAEDAFDRALYQLAATSPNAVGILYAFYWDLARKVQAFARKESMHRLTDLVLDPLKRLTDALKTIETRKKAFEQESKAFYEHMNKYLAVKNEQASSGGRAKASYADGQTKLKRDRFKLARQTYFNSLQELGIFKECATLATLTQYARSINDIYVSAGQDLAEEVPILDEFDLRIDTVSTKIETRKLQMETERREAERQFAMQAGAGDSSGVQQVFQSSRASPGAHQMPKGSKGIGSETDLPAPHVALNAALESNISSEHSINDTDPQWLIPASPSFEALTSGSTPPARTSSQVRRKEGFLWANARPVSHQSNPDHVRYWNKYWVVLAGGQLCEYADDRLELNTSPMNLRFATVRKVKMQDRRFTFEVITPSLRRIYQATSSEEAEEWQNTITNVIQSLLDGTTSVRHFTSRQYSEDSKSPKELGLGIFAGDRQRQPSGSGDSDQAEGSRDRQNGAGEGMRAVLAKLNKPLQRKSSEKHRKRDSVASFVSNFAVNSRRRDKDVGSPLAALVEASQSMTSFFNQAGHAHSGAHGKSASGPLTDTSPAPVQATTQPRSPVDLDKSIEDAVVTAFGPLKPAKQTRGSKERNAKELRQLLRLSENLRCADCLSTEPRWASWNVGIFICIRCSGIHRSLGSHISKVRSVDLDDWSDEQLECMKMIGNGTARTVWEPPDLPAEMRSDENIKSLITMKYVEKRWCNA